MPRLDIHTHILPAILPKWAEQFGYGGFIRLDPSGPCRARMMRDDGTFFREIESNCWDAAQRRVESAETQVDVQVLSTVPVMFNYWTKPAHGLDIARFLNDHIANICRSQPAHFVGLGTLPMQDPQVAIAELERCVLELGLAGVQIGSHVGAWNLDAPELFPIFQRAAQLNTSIFVHPWDMAGQNDMPKYWLPWLVGMPAEVSRAICSLIFGGVLERLPTLRWCFAHGGGSFGATIGRIQHGFAARPDLCAVDNSRAPTEYLGKFWVDSLVHDARTLRFIIDVFGHNRVALGSDYPFPLGESHPGQLIESLNELPASVRAQLLWQNGWDWLGRAPL